MVFLHVFTELCIYARFKKTLLYKIDHAHSYVKDFPGSFWNKNFSMKEAIGHYDIVIFSLTSVVKRFIESIIEGVPSLQVPTHWFHDRPQDSK
jgi:hypothetical protein